VLQSGGRFVPGLKGVEEVRREADLAGIGSKNGHLAAEKADPAGRNGHLAATSPECLGEVLLRATPWMAGRKMAGTRGLAAVSGEPIRAVNGSAA
jgi:hypothetical protein